MNTWKSVIFVKTERPMSDLSEMSKWDGVEKLWSTMGPWDICVEMDSDKSSPKDAEMLVSRMRENNWATETQTMWWKSMGA